MPLNFPNSPVDGQIYTTTSGDRYSYSSSVGAWLSVAETITGNTLNGQIIYNSSNDVGGSNGLLYLATSNTVALNNVSVTLNVSAQYFYGNGAFLSGVVSDFSPAFDQANTARTHANNAYAKANTANITADLAFGQANTANITADLAYGQANTARTHANNAYAKANTANITADLAFGKANTANITADLAFGKANTANITADLAFGKANTANITADLAFGKANTANITADLAYGQANTARTHANNAYAKANTANITADLAFGTANIAWAVANSKFSSNGGTITGDVSIVGTLSISGNTQFVNVSTFAVQDPLIYLASNNYVSDVVDIGFIGNYVNATGQNVHTGLYREHIDKMYYLFNGYDKEPANNHIGALSNNMTLAVLNADLITSNLSLAGANAVLWIRSSFDQANTARTHANNAYAKANAAGGGFYSGNNGDVGSAAGLGDIFRIHSNTLTENVTIYSGNNSLAAGPITVSAGKTLTIQEGARVSIV